MVVLVVDEHGVSILKRKRKAPIGADSNSPVPRQNAFQRLGCKGILDFSLIVRGITSEVYAGFESLNANWPGA